MNRTLLPRDRGNRIADSLRASRFAGIASRTWGLVGGTADSSERKTPPGGTQRSESGAMMLGTSLARNVGRFLRRWARRVALFGLLCVIVPVPLRGRSIHHCQSGRITKGVL
jgi:hypothetical protein